MRLRLLVIATFVAVLLQILSAPTFGEPGSDEIIVNNADEVRTESVVRSQSLEDSTASIGPRIVVQYANEIRHLKLINVPGALQSLLEQVSERIVVQYANEIRQIELVQIPTQLLNVLGQVGDRIIIQYANENRTIGLAYPEGLVSDSSAPLISDVRATNVFTNTATILWTTNEFVNSRVNYGYVSGAHPLTTYDPLFGEDHIVVLNGLIPNTAYFFGVNSTDLSGNTAQSGEYSFTTQPQGPGEATVTPTSTIPLPPTNTPTITPTPTATPYVTATSTPTPTATAEPIVCPTTTTPVDVVLIIDRSLSMQGQPLVDEKAAAQNFVDLMKLEQDQVGLVSFSDNATLNQPLTADGNAVKNAIAAMNGGGYTNMTAALTMSQTELASERHNPTARPVMLFMSDGVPAGGDTSAAALAAAQLAKDAGTRIFTIGLGSVDANLMRQLASEPGDYYFAPASVDLDAIYRTIAEVVLCGEATIKVSPADSRVALGGGAFTVDIVAEDVAHLAAYQIELQYDPGIVQLENVEQGPFLGSTGRSVAVVAPIVNPTEGLVIWGAFTFGTQPGVNGTGVLSTITFQPQASGVSTLSLQNVQAADETSNPLTFSTADGQVEIIGCFGDLDGDSDVDIFDLQLVASHWNCRSGDACYEVRFDTEPDGDIDAFDLQRFAAAWGTTCTPAQALRSSSLHPTTAVSLSLHPASVQLLPGGTTTLSLHIQDAADIGTFQTDLVFDPAIVHVESIALTDLLGATGRIVSPLGPAIDNDSGRATFGAFTLGNQAGVSGAGDLAIITLRSTGLGEMDLSLQQTGVGDTQGEALPLGALAASHIHVSDQIQLYLPVMIR